MRWRVRNPIKNKIERLQAARHPGGRTRREKFQWERARVESARTDTERAPMGRGNLDRAGGSRRSISLRGTFLFSILFIFFFNIQSSFLSRYFRIIFFVRYPVREMVNFRLKPMAMVKNNNEIRITNYGSISLFLDLKVLIIVIQ